MAEHSDEAARGGRDATDRRTFLQAGALASAALAGGVSAVRGQEPAAKDSPKAVAMPTRPLGKTGVNVSILDQGAVRASGLDRLYRTSFAAGVRVFDTAKVYGTEPSFKKWFETDPAIRKQIFLVTKDELRTADKLVASIDQRLAALGTDSIDLFFLHGLGDHHTVDQAKALLQSKELAQAVEAVKKSGKVKFFGFSTHHKDRAAMIEAAAGGDVVDAIMLQYSPWLDKESPLNKALDACWKKGIGLISMKQIAGKMFGDAPKGDVLKEVARRAPVLAERKLSPFQGLLHAIWTDERISSVCTSMKTTEQIRENADAAWRFEPLKPTEVAQIRDAVLSNGPTLCADCDGRCSIAAGTKAELGNLTRFLTYHEHLGNRSEARLQYARLDAEARDWSGADLNAARAACPSGLDFAALLPRVDKHLA